MLHGPGQFDFSIFEKKWYFSKMIFDLVWKSEYFLKNDVKDKKINEKSENEQIQFFSERLKKTWIALVT